MEGYGWEEINKMIDEVLDAHQRSSDEEKEENYKKLLEINEEIKKHYSEEKFNG